MCGLVCEQPLYPWTRNTTIAIHWRVLVAGLSARNVSLSTVVVEESGSYKVICHIWLVQQNRNRVNKNDRSNVGSYGCGLQEMSCNYRTISSENTNKPDSHIRKHTHECDTSTNWWNPCCRRIPWSWRHISSFGSIGDVSLEEMHKISTARIPIRPSSSRRP